MKLRSERALGGRVDPAPGGPWAPGLALRALGPRAMSFLPAATLGAHAVGGEGAMLAFAAMVPVAAAVALRGATRTRERSERDGLTGLVLRAGVAARLDQALVGIGQRGRTTACLVIELDEFRRIADRLGMAMADEVLRRVGERLVRHLPRGRRGGPARRRRLRRGAGAGVARRPRGRPPARRAAPGRRRRAGW